MREHNVMAMPFDQVSAAPRADLERLALVEQTPAENQPSGILSSAPACKQRRPRSSWPPCCSKIPTPPPPSRSGRSLVR